MKLPRATESFRFFTRLSLQVVTGVRAADLREMMEGIRSSPDSVIYTHTYRFLQQYQSLVPEPTNDFAVWVAESLQDEEAGEKLMAVDAVRYGSIAELRQALASTLDAHLRKRGESRRAPPGEEFHFMRSIRFSLPTPYAAGDLAEFSGALRLVSVSSLYLHVFEARLRPPLGLNDFSMWLDSELGERALAMKISRLDPYTQTLDALRARILKMVESRIEELSHA